MATNWGIISAGKISHDFVSALRTLPSNEHYVRHLNICVNSKYALHLEALNNPITVYNLNKLNVFLNLKYFFCVTCLGGGHRSSKSRVSARIRKTASNTESLWLL